MPDFLRKNLATVVVGVVVAAILVVALLVTGGTRSSEGNLVALVHAGDGSVTALPLDEDGSYEFSTSLGTNVVVVEDGAVRMLEADCPGKDCVRQHSISTPGQQLICLPHQLWVEIAPEGSDGGEMDVTAVSPEDGVDVQAR